MLCDAGGHHEGDTAVLDSPAGHTHDKMRFSTFITLAAAPLLALAAPQQQQQQQEQDTPLITAAPESNIVAPLPTQTVAPGAAWNDDAANVQLELRQAIDLLATQAATQVPVTQDYWIADHWDSAQSTEIWTEVKYTQTFVTHPGQWTTAGAGSVGLGTHTGEIGVAKAATGAAASVMPQGSLFTAVLGLAGVAAGMGVVFL
ncbi:hypothetical protein D6D10_01754 [Aureobasidium pullulans]|uniref:Uncharacterized protein n=2 Tax=Aureobasidium pullulans TaxID=5580 RepID=A0A4S9F7P8_AURPU|nr:hypothetical protein D6D10_01754 [Aureobasidium pullulans]